MIPIRDRSVPALCLHRCLFYLFFLTKKHNRRFFAVINTHGSARSFVANPFKPDQCSTCYQFEREHRGYRAPVFAAPTTVSLLAPSTGPTAPAPPPLGAFNASAAYGRSGAVAGPSAKPAPLAPTASSAQPAPVSCMVCRTRVTAFDRANIVALDVHAACFACSLCRVPLTPTRYNVSAGQLFCLQHVPSPASSPSRPTAASVSAVGTGPAPPPQPPLAQQQQLHQYQQRLQQSQQPYQAYQQPPRGPVNAAPVAVAAPAAPSKAPAACSVFKADPARFGFCASCLFPLTAHPV
jgi:hypothetical protein